MRKVKQDFSTLVLTIPGQVSRKKSLPEYLMIGWKSQMVLFVYVVIVVRISPKMFQSIAMVSRVKMA
ncbi:hypothetical protein ES703_110672 [subsurface metagenome]